MSGHTKQPARYVYAITDDIEARGYGKIGIDGASVYTIALGPLAAVVSDAPNRKIRPERSKLAAHHAVVTQLMTKRTVLPLVFGTIAGSAQAVSDILKNNHNLFVEQLKRLDGKVEMGLKVTWDVPNIFEYFVNRHRNLAALRDDLVAKAGPSRDEKIELGRTFEHLLLQEREADTKKVVRVLSRHCAEIKQNKPRQEREIMRLACLVGREERKDFEDGVFEAAKLFDDSYAFDFTGPWSPYNFVSGLQLNIGTGT